MLFGAGGLWENLVTACKPCNHRKGGKSVAEARMALRNQPQEPRAGAYYTIERRLDTHLHRDWQKFLPQLELPSRRIDVDLVLARTEAIPQVKGGEGPQAHRLARSLGFEPVGSRVSV